MKKIIFLFAILSFCFFCINLHANNKSKSNTMKQSNPTINTIMSRKSVRSFTSDTVSIDILNTIVKAAMAAPTAVNMQPWAFVVVNNRETLDKLAEELPYAKMLFEATAAIIVCAIPKESIENNSLEYSILDCAAASENILLAVESFGLGAVWTAVYPDTKRIEFVRSFLNIPNDIIPVNIIPIGYPSGENKPKDKYKPEKIHWNKW